MAIPLIAWDASALAKRYLAEVGSEAVDAIFKKIAPLQMLTTTIGYAETFACIVRTRNRGAISQPKFLEATTSLRDEILDELDFAVLSIDDAVILEGLDFVDRYSLNSVDAAILAAYLRFQKALPEDRARCVLVASDRRLLSAAEAEGLKTLNPEIVNVADVPALIASLS